MMNNSLYNILLASALLAPCSHAVAQDAVPADEEAQKVIVLPPLFEYPVAPEDMDWNDRSGWLVEHFWDNFDFKQSAVGQQQLNHAFYTWTVPMHYCKMEIMKTAVDKVVKKLEKNPTLLLQFTRAAEYNVYAPETAQVWIDDLYLSFLNAVSQNKKISKTQKMRYALQHKVLLNTRRGEPLPQFAFTERSGMQKNFNPSGTTTIVEFGDPSCSDCQMARIALKSDDYIRDLVANGRLNIYFVIPDAEGGDTSWMEDVLDYPDAWTVGAAESLEDMIDLRLTPSLYLINADGNLVMKNVGLDELRRGIKTEMDLIVSEDATSVAPVDAATEE